MSIATCPICGKIISLRFPIHQCLSNKELVKQNMRTTKDNKIKKEKKENAKNK